MMVEGEMNEVSEAEMLEAIKFAHTEIKKHCKIQEELAAAVGKAKRTYCHETNDEAVREMVKKDLYQKCYDHANLQQADKHLRSDGFKAILDEYLEAYQAANAENTEIDLAKNVKLIKKYYHDVEKEPCARMILDKDTVSMAVQPLKSVQSGAKLIICQDRTFSNFHPGETHSLTSVYIGYQMWMKKSLTRVTVQGTEKFPAALQLSIVQHR
jgi:polyribonucleotide nucleotidyltransferase